MNRMVRDICKMSKGEQEIAREHILRRALMGEKFKDIGHDYCLTSDGIMRKIQFIMESGELSQLVDELGPAPDEH